MVPNVNIDQALPQRGLRVHVRLSFAFAIAFFVVMTTADMLRTTPIRLDVFDYLAGSLFAIAVVMGATLLGATVGFSQCRERTISIGQAVLLGALYPLFMWLTLDRFGRAHLGEIGLFYLVGASAGFTWLGGHAAKFLPQLRWRPSAEMVGVMVLVMFVSVFVGRISFLLGVRQGERNVAVFSSPGREWLKFEREPTQPGFQTLASARAFDGVVVRWAHEEDERAHHPTTRILRALEDRIFGATPHGPAEARHWAEYRLKTLSGASPQWQATAHICDELGPGFDARPELDRAAEAYTRVLGRQITATQLAPLIPNAHCEAQER